MTTREFQQKKPLSILFTYFKPHRGLFILDLVCATVVALIDLAFPLVTRKSMYDLLPNQQYRTFFIVMGVMMAAFIVRAFILCHFLLGTHIRHSGGGGHPPRPFHARAGA